MSKTTTDFRQRLSLNLDREKAYFRFYRILWLLISSISIT